MFNTPPQCLCRASGHQCIETKARAQDLTSHSPVRDTAVTSMSELETQAWRGTVTSPAVPHVSWGGRGPTPQASPDRASRSLRPALSMMRAATAVKSTWMTPTVTEARLLSWGGEGWSAGRPEASPPPSLSSPELGDKAQGLRAIHTIWMKSWAEASYLELGLFEDGLSIEHDGVDP